MQSLTGELFFLGLAQIAVAFPGFTGLIIAVRQRSHTRWSPGEAAAFKFIFGHCFLLLTFALLPFPLYYLLGHEPYVWKTCHVVLPPFLGAIIIVQFYRVFATSRAGHPPAKPGLMFALYFPPSLALLGVQIYCIAHPSMFWYCIALINMLFQAGMQFRIAFDNYTDVEE